MKLVVTSVGETIKSSIDPRFGRAAWFVLVDTDSGARAATSNDQNMNAAQGAGIQAAQTVSRLGADCLITGHCGPKAFRALAAAGVAVYTGAEGTVEEAIESYQAGRLQRSEQADVRGHWA